MVSCLKLGGIGREKPICASYAEWMSQGYTNKAWLEGITRAARWHIFSSSCYTNCMKSIVQHKCDDLSQLTANQAMHLSEEVK